MPVSKPLYSKEEFGRRFPVCSPLAAQIWQTLSAKFTTIATIRG